MDVKVLDGKLFANLINNGASNLKNNSTIVNDLNVFPIPDGDTGENMSLTMFGGVNACKNNVEHSLAKVSKKVANGMLLSARGNSGVILSQFFAGIAKGFENIDNATPFQVGEAFKCGVKTAYNAVINPTEGTILTVARESVEYAFNRLNENSTINSFFNDLETEMKESLKRTPELLNVLKEAGVIDSGGAGLLYIFDGVCQSLKGIEVDNSFIKTNENKTSTIDLSKFNENSVMKFGYCTEFLLQLQRCKIDVDKFDINELISFLSSVGDSIVAFLNGTIVKVHVHTFNPGYVLEHCQKYGEFLTLKIENMTLQHNETTIQNRFEDITTKKVVKTGRKKYAIVAVASGDGIINTFKDLGADYVINGGQTNNPSAKDFIEAFDKVNADNIFVLPDNSNVILAAKQAANLYEDSNIHVINSKNIGDGYSILSLLDYSSNNVDTIIQQMNEAMDEVTTGQITLSIRDASLNGVTINKGDFIGFTDKIMLSANKDKLLVAYDLLDKLNFASKEVLIAIYGNNVSNQEKEALRKHIKEKYSRKEIFEIDGKQDVYEFLFII